jgi:hypothetical protein
MAVATLTVLLAACGAPREATQPQAPATTTQPATPLPVPPTPIAAAQPSPIPLPTHTGPAPRQSAVEPGASPSPAALASDSLAFGQALEQHGPFEAPAEGAQAAALPEVQNPWLHLFPELRGAPAPDWLQEGVRVTYYGQSATLAQVADEDTVGAAGYLQNDLVALDEEIAVSSVKFYLSQADGSATPSFVLSSLGLPGAGDYWLSPTVLRDAEDVANDELIVLHMPTEVAGQAHNAVRFEYRPAGAVYVWMFDAESGVLLFYRHTIGEEGDTHVQAADLTLVAQRQLSLPWNGRSVPAWATEGSALRWEGAYTPLVMGQPAGSFPYIVRADALRSRTRWTEHQLAASVAGQPQGVTRRATGVAQLFDALWLPFQALSSLRDGQVLDRDPVTGAQVAVSRPGGGTVVLTESGAGYYTALAYDERDGVLVSMEQEILTGAAGSFLSLLLATWP